MIGVMRETFVSSVVHIWGAHINRDTVDNVRLAGFAGVAETNLSLDIVKRVEAFRRSRATEAT